MPNKQNYWCSSSVFWWHLLCFYIECFVSITGLAYTAVISIFFWSWFPVCIKEKLFLTFKFEALKDYIFFFFVFLVNAFHCILCFLWFQLQLSIIDVQT